MREIKSESFALLCFLVLMQNGNGIMDKAPEYLAEKALMLHEGWEAFGFLDINNMRKVMAWCERWKVELPQNILERFKLEEEAAAQFGM